jgi:hypothetical protein
MVVNGTLEHYDGTKWCNDCISILIMLKLTYQHALLMLDHLYSIFTACHRPSSAIRSSR